MNNYKEAGLSDAEVTLLQMPLSQLTKDQWFAALKARDKLADYNVKQPYRNTGGMIVHDVDSSFKKDAVLSPCDNRAYSNRREWNDMLKRNNCVEVGNDVKVKKRELAGNYNCREALTKATREVLSRQQ